MMEVMWVSIFGLLLAWLQSNSADASEPVEIEIEVEDDLASDVGDDLVSDVEGAEDTWARWEEEIHDWRER